jgi:hypothetical protein
MPTPGTTAASPAPAVAASSSTSRGKGPLIQKRHHFPDPLQPANASLQFPGELVATLDLASPPIMLFAVRQGIHLRNLRLGRPLNDPGLATAEKQQFSADRRQHTAIIANGLCAEIEKIHQGKRRHGLAPICERPLVRQSSIILKDTLMMNS